MKDLRICLDLFVTERIFEEKTLIQKSFPCNQVYILSKSHTIFIGKYLLVVLPSIKQSNSVSIRNRLN